jgi:hypothetical protein
MALRSGSLMAAARSASETVHGVRLQSRRARPGSIPTQVGREGAKQLVVGRESGDLTSTADENRGPECLGASLLL